VTGPRTTPRVALIEPLGDPGIGTYAHELAEALGAAGAYVDLYTNSTAFSVTRLTRHHRVLPVLGSALVRQRGALRAPAATVTADAPWRSSAGGTATLARRQLRGAVGLRGSYLSLELAWWLRRMAYDLVWTQWPSITDSPTSFWWIARAMGLPLVHTAHNVLPHERRAGDLAPYRSAYRRSRAVIVHSRAAGLALARTFTEAASKVLVAPHGLYTAYQRNPEGRHRLRQALGLASDERLILCFGGIRPYKNSEAVIDALKQDSPRFRLLIAGRESGYPDSNREDPLGRMRRLVAAAGLNARVHLRVGPFAYGETAAMFEAADVVALPYLESYGSGVLLLAMSFGKPVIATATGGMEEYLRHYPAHEMVTTPTGQGVRDALTRLDTRLRRSGGLVPAPRPSQFEWITIARDLLPQLLERAA
jgi:glycosyltransferase involved in cell wall biosynthesis